jgi:ABC-type glycerol-3-phosphate transport system substrate-binding protein
MLRSLALTNLTYTKIRIFVNLKGFLTKHFFLFVVIMLSFFMENESIKSPLFAQNSYVTLTLSLPMGMEYLQNAHVFEMFEQQNPDTRINVVYSDLSTLRYTSASQSLEEHLEGAENYSSGADVFMVSVGASLPPEISIEASRAGYFLDLAPLLQADADFSSEDFYRSIWQSVTWDAGVWLLPVAANVYTVIYDRTTFDERGLSYPDGSWDIATYINTIQSLVEQDNNEVTLSPSFIGYNRSDLALMYSFLGSPLYDSMTIPTLPDFDRPEVIELAEVWSLLYESGAAYNPDYPYSDFQIEAPPFTVDRIQTTIANTNVGAALLPNDRAAITVTGFAVSGQTLYPEAAYRLVKFLANDVRVADAVVTMFSMTTRARSSYTQTEAIEDAPFILGDLSPENNALLQEAIQNAIPTSELHFFDYFYQALLSVANEGLDAQAALQYIQVQAQTALQTAAEYRGQTAAGIPTPVPTVELAAGEVSIHFRFSTFSQLPTMSAWDQFIDDFVSNDPQVGQVIFDTQTNDPNRTAENFDCFYLPYNAITQLNLNNIASLSPLISSDIDISVDDFLPTVLSQVQLDNEIWAFPLDFYPEVIWYNSELLTQANIPLPEFDWGGNAFEDALTQLQTIYGEAASFSSPRLGTTLLMLIAAYGGLPIDYRVSPPIINFTSLENITATRQVLDLARNGLIKYERLAEISADSQLDDAPMFADIFTFANLGQIETTPIAFPIGIQYSPTAYDLGTAYISRNSPNPEACYRLIASLSNRPDLFSGIPVRRSTLTSSAVTTMLGEDIVSFYERYASLLNSPSAVVFPLSIGANSASAFVLQYWLFGAFDAYTLENANLEDMLQQAEQLTIEFQRCAGNLPPFDPDSQTVREHNRQIVACAIQIDPDSASYFSFGGE